MLLRSILSELDELSLRSLDFARNGYTTECINFHEKQRAGELSVDRGSGSSSRRLL